MRMVKFLALLATLSFAAPCFAGSSLTGVELTGVELTGVELTGVELMARPFGLGQETTLLGRSAGFHAAAYWTSALPGEQANQLESLMPTASELIGPKLAESDLRASYLGKKNSSALICQHEFGYSADFQPPQYQTGPGAPAYQPPGRSYAAQAPTGYPSPVPQNQIREPRQAYPNYAPANQTPNQTNMGYAPQQAQPAYPQSMIVTSTMNVDGYTVKEYKGIVRGVAVYSPTIMQSFKAGFKQIIGGNIGSYTQMSDRARQQAYDHMVQNAVAQGANAVIGLRYDSSAFNTDKDGSMGTEVMCYGTAVTISR
ncbi:MAG: heavy metal-binding domain-containing protein [Candidatus Obscuribacterales bacterium]|nr:heavy metal-binding domain-containing protein [Candidatus Obscuribacterales bacterium]